MGQPISISNDEIIVSYTLLLFADFTSIIGCGIVLIAFWRLRLLRNHVTKVIACFCGTSVAKDIPSTILTLTRSSQGMGFPCYFYSILITYGSLSCWMWTLCLAISIYRLIVKRDPDVEKYEKWYYLSCWGAPVIPTIIMLAKNTVIYLGNWCWISGKHIAYRFVLFYVPFFIIFFVSAILVGITMRYTYNVIHNGVSDNRDKHFTYQFKLVNYIVVFLVCWLFAVINRILNSIGYYPTVPNILHTYLSVSHGFFASCAFIYNNPLLWRYLGCKVLKVFAAFGFFVETYRKLEKNKNNNNPSPYTSSRGITSTPGGGKTFTTNDNPDSIEVLEMEPCPISEDGNISTPVLTGADVNPRNEDLNADLSENHQNGSSAV